MSKRSQVIDTKSCAVNSEIEAKLYDDANQLELIFMLERDPIEDKSNVVAEIKKYSINITAPETI